MVVEGFGQNENLEHEENTQLGKNSMFLVKPISGHRREQLLLGLMVSKSTLAKGECDQLSHLWLLLFLVDYFFYLY